MGSGSKSGHEAIFHDEVDQRFFRNGLALSKNDASPRFFFPPTARAPISVGRARSFHFTRAPFARAR